MEFKKGVEGEGEEGGGRRLLISHRCVLNLSRTASVTSRSRRSSESFVIAAREGFVGGGGGAKLLTVNHHHHVPLRWFPSFSVI